MSHCFIGTSGWNYPHWQETFYPSAIKKKDHFLYYQKFFKTVELNNPFYRLPEKKTFEKWYAESDKDFVFAVKANRFITHMKKLNDPLESLQRMLGNADGLKEKLGPVLFQLPPFWRINEERFKNFLRALPKGYRYVFEFRNPTWETKATYALLEKYNCAYCIYELAGHVTKPLVTADFVYLRLHGPGDKYQGSYSLNTLRSWARKIKKWKTEKKDVYVYFDNDQAAYAVKNALTLKELV